MIHITIISNDSYYFLIHCAIINNDSYYNTFYLLSTYYVLNQGCAKGFFTLYLIYKMISK